MYLYVRAVCMYLYVRAVCMYMYARTVHSSRHQYLVDVTPP